MTEHETHEFDVVVIGAGGAGLRAAIEARDRGARTALVCKSLLGKAHTVMADHCGCSSPISQATSKARQAPRAVRKANASRSASNP